MSLQADKAIVGNITTKFGTLYIADRAGITLDGNSYDNTIIETGIVEYLGNIGENRGGEAFRIGNYSMSLANGEDFDDNGYKYDVTDIWNNDFVEIKIWSSGNTSFDSDCVPLIKGILKDMTFTEDSISFDIDAKDVRDDQSLPRTVTRNQGEETYKQGLFSASSGDKTINYSAPVFIFESGELVILIANDGTGNSEVRQIKSVSGANLTFDQAIRFDYPSSPFPGIIRKAFINIPSDNVGLTVPIQVGNLTDSANGVFAKGLISSEKIGEQRVVFDGVELRESSTGIGLWENSLKRFFLGKPVEVSGIDVVGEYTVMPGNNTVLFRVDALTTLNADITNVSPGIDVIVLNSRPNVDGQLKWVDEDDSDINSDTFPELLSSNIIQIDDELMLVIQKPVYDTGNFTRIAVERGYNGTLVTTHSRGANVYQVARNSARNIISFTELFPATVVANQVAFNQSSSAEYSAVNILGLTYVNYLTNGQWNYVVDSDTTTSISFSLEGFQLPLLVNFDVKFADIESDFTAFNAYAAVNGTARFVAPDVAGVKQALALIMYSPKEPTIRLQNYFDDGQAKGTYVVYIEAEKNEDSGTLTFDTWSTISRDTFTDSPGGTLYVLKPNFNAGNPSPAPDKDGTPFQITSLKDLNSKWKMSLGTVDDLGVSAFIDTALFTLKNFGVWVDFFTKFTDKIIVSPLEGRPVTSDLVSVTRDDTPSRVGQLAENPVDVLALILLQEMGYETTDFTADWKGVYDYYQNPLNFEASSPANSPKVAFSYGLEDDRKNGWNFLSEIASHFNLSLIRGYDGSLDIVNLHQIYFGNPEATEINIEDILFVVNSHKQRITVKHTGTNLIYNDIIVNYNRNNATGKYQATYILPDTYEFINTPISLLGARQEYFNGEKRTLEITSPYIYNEDDARRKAEFEAEDKATSHIWVRLFIDFDHWTDKANKEAQYKIGDVVYLNGKFGGIEFTSDNRLYVQNVRFPDGPREIELHLWSLQSVTDFTTTATSGEFVWQDTGGTAITGDSVKDDTGGTSVTGDDIKEDTGG